MDVIEIIRVDPEYQRRGVSARLTEFATDYMRRCGPHTRAAVGYAAWSQSAATDEIGAAVQSNQNADKNPARRELRP